MFESIVNFLVQETLIVGYVNWVVLLAVVIITTVLIWTIKKYLNDKYAISFWIMNAFYNWPLIGRSSKHKKDITTDNGWTSGEIKLCEDYYFEYDRKRSLNDNYYNLSRDYLSKAEEIGRKPIPFWVWFLLVSLVFAEAVIFGKLILTFVGEFSTNEVKIFSLLVAFLLAIILVWITDRTGTEWYKNSKIKKIKVWQATEDGDNKSVPIPNTQIGIQTSYLDNDDKKYKQLLNRVANLNATVSKSYGFTLVAIILISAIAIIAFIQRATLNVDTINETPYAAYATYIFFSLVFLFIQMIGIYVGYHYSFVSKEGEKAWRSIYKYNTADEFYRPIKTKTEYIKSQAQINLGKLQKYLNDKHEDLDIELNNTFHEYVKIKNEKEKSHNEII